MLTCGDQSPSAVGMIAAVSLRLLYLIFQQVIGLVLLRAQQARNLVMDLGEHVARFRYLVRDPA